MSDIDMKSLRLYTTLYDPVDYLTTEESIQSFLDEFNQNGTEREKRTAHYIAHQARARLMSNEKLLSEFVRFKDEALFSEFLACGMEIGRRSLKMPSIAEGESNG